MSNTIELADSGAPTRLALAAALAARVQILRDLALYGLASAVALAVDWGMLAVFVHRGVPVAAAAAASFSLGMIVTYVASAGFIFADRRSGSKLREMLLFVLIGLVGLGLNVLLICAFGAVFGLPATIAKAPTTALVFLFNFATRRALLFRDAEVTKRVAP